MLTFHSSAIILASGDELLTGQLLDTNSRWIAQRLVALGILPIELTAVPDDLPRLVAALRRAAIAAPLIILSGGLGPTEGDLTRQALAELLNEELIIDEPAETAIRTLLEKRARPMTDRQRRQAFRPTSATCLPNPLGTAPGLHARLKLGTGHSTLGTDLFCLPGPPGELRPMFDREVLPRLRPDPSRTIITRLLHIVGLPEADCVDRLANLTKRDRDPRLPLVGITASGGILTLRIRYEGPGPAAVGEALVNETESTARAALKDHLLPRSTHPDDSGSTALARHILTSLASRSATLATVESCTGGMLGEILTAIPGSSTSYLGGFVTYANALKESLGVNPALIQAHGAVSAEVAQAMAAAGLAQTSATHALSITGIAGPDGGTPTKPVGMVHIALASRSSAQPRSRRFFFTGDREDIRRRAAASALTMLHFHLAAHPAGSPRLLWETT